MATITIDWRLLNEVLPDGSNNPALQIVKIFNRSRIDGTAVQTSRRNHYFEVDDNTIRVSSLFVLLSTGLQHGLYVEASNYPSWMVFDVGILGVDVPEYLNAAQVEEPPGVFRNRHYNEMPGYFELLGGYYAAASDPIAGTNSGSDYYPGTTIYKLSQELGVTIINAQNLPQLEEIV